MCLAPTDVIPLPYNYNRHSFTDMTLTFSQSSRLQSRLIIAAIALVSFLVGLMIPSPVFLHRDDPFADTGEEDLFATVDTTGMALPRGGVYEGSVIVKTKKPHGFGVLKKEQSTYEGNWRNGKLPYGRRTTAQATYEGRFDDELNSHGFGIATYTPLYIDGKRKQGLPDNQIVTTYIGNWRRNVKEGLGRAVKADSSMVFGHFRDGLFKVPEGAAYNVGDRVYGIDVSHHQHDIDWDRLALYCDSTGSAYTGKPADKRFMQPVFFAYIKATEGATIKDRTYDLRAVEAERHGIVKGAYHFLRLGSDLDEQVRNFTETANWTVGDLPPALDVEVESEIKSHGAEKLLDMTFGWLEAVEEKMDVRPIIYTRENIRDTYLAKDPRFKKYQCWIARYHPAGPRNGRWTIWQLSEKGAANGYDGDIDINLYNGDYATFNDLFKRPGQPSRTK